MSYWRCYRKRPYLTRKFAYQVLANMRKDSPDGRLPTLQVYRCSVCKFWHLGNRKKKAREVA